MHLYTLVAAPFVMELLHVASPADPMVREKSSWIQAAFLVGWALGGAFFGRLGDRLGRSRALSLTILTYAAFTGLSFVAQTWWHLLIFRFLAAPGVAELFRGDILPITLKTIALCALSLTAWWAFMFWHAQHLRNLPELASWARADRERLVSKAFFIVTCASIVGNFAVGGLARLVGYRRAIALMCLGLGLSMMGSFGVPRGPESLVYVWYPIVGLV